MNQITKKIKITSQEIDDILCSAFEGGISYWATSAIVKDQPKGQITWAHEAISQGGTVTITDDDGEAHLLTKQNFLDGLAKYDNHDFEQFDASDADNVVQLALFGELVYA